MHCEYVAAGDQSILSSLFVPEVDRGLSFLHYLPSLKCGFGFPFVTKNMRPQRDYYHKSSNFTICRLNQDQKQLQ